MKTNKTYISIVLLLCIIFALSNCKKNEPKGYVEMDTDSSVIKHFNFLPGSYWIYKDAIGGRIDSFFVQSNTYELQEENYNLYNYHLITIAEYNLDGTAIADSASWVFSYQGTRVMVDYCYTTDAYGWKNRIQFAPLFMYPFAIGDLVGRYDSSEVTQFDTVYSLNGHDFRNVAHVYHESDADSITGGTNITKLKDWFFINDSVGLIRMQLSHPNHGINRAWELLRYKIER